MHRASRELFGRELEWAGINAAGGLDPLLFAEAARQTRISVGPRERDAFRERYVRLLCAEVRRSTGEVKRMPGARELLLTLRARKEAILGLLTGNYAGAAACKLAAVDIDLQWFEVTAFGDEAPSRPELGAVALEMYESVRNNVIDPQHVVIIGDTPRDVECARANGFLAFAVATGKSTREELLAAGAHVAVEDLTDPEPLLSLVFK
jgi:phosphoglycolate phosphatase-like HAD superfamily hydrolase